MTLDACSASSRCCGWHTEKKVGIWESSFKGLKVGLLEVFFLILVLHETGKIMWRRKKKKTTKQQMRTKDDAYKTSLEEEEKKK